MPPTVHSKQDAEISSLAGHNLQERKKVTKKKKKKKQEGGGKKEGRKDVDCLIERAEWKGTTI